MSWQPKFLTLEQVLILHQSSIEQFGGHPGVKDKALLLSALGQAESGFGDQYFHQDLYAMAAAYLFHLVKNHAFHDGNKRIAAQSLVIKEQIAQFFRNNTSNISE